MGIQLAVKPINVSPVLADWITSIKADGDVVRVPGTDLRDLLESKLIKPVIAAAVNTEALKVTGYSLTGSDASSMIDLTGTWNTSGVPTAIKLNMTNTASGIGTKLIELKIGGLSNFSVGVFGDITLGADVSLVEDGPGQLAQRNFTAAQEFRVYNTFGNFGADVERFKLEWKSNVLVMSMEASGTGTLRDIHFGGSGDKIGFYETTAVAQPSGTGETTGFTAGSGTGVNDDSTFTGNVGSTAYRLSDVVKHLKNLGLIAA